jgi:hypothetical protein
MNRFFIGYWIKNGLDFYPALLFLVDACPALPVIFQSVIFIHFYMFCLHHVLSQIQLGAGFEGVDCNQLVFIFNKKIFRCNYFYLFQRLIFEFS